MKKKNYTRDRKGHLGTYAKELHLPIGGEWQGKGSYSHILKFEKGADNYISRENKHRAVCEKNILPGVLSDMFSMHEMHRYAHHLNSSQVLCYNYFRPLITEDCNPTEELVSLLKKQGIKISSSAICSFEYCPDKEEKTQFDFHVQDGNIEVFFEIKYTEDGFGKAEKDNAHKNKFKTTYNDYLEKQTVLTSRPEFEEFANHYQLYRNAIRITDKNKYVILLYPEANEKTNIQALEFCKKVKHEYKDNMLCLYWERIVDKESELYRKYFA